MSAAEIATNHYWTNPVPIDLAGEFLSYRMLP